MTPLQPRSGLRPTRGFTLLELAVVLTIMGALALLATRTARPDEFALSEQLLLRGEADLQAFLAANGRLPCADQDGDGFEDCAGVQRGGMPWATLGQEAGEFRALNLVLNYSVHDRLTTLPPGSGWGSGSSSTGKYGQLLVVLRQQRNSPSGTQPYLASDTAAAAMSDCSFKQQNLGYALRTVPRPAGPEPVCVQPVAGVRNTLRYMSLQALETHLLGLPFGSP